MMKVVIQRVTEAFVCVNGNVVGKIQTGLMLLVGITHKDTTDTIDWCVRKILNLRIFNDNEGKLNLSIQDVCGSLLVVSQFTLYADMIKGNRPSFIEAASPEIAIPLYEYFLHQLKQSGVAVECGIFGADMQVGLVNDGPITIILEK